MRDDTEKLPGASELHLSEDDLIKYHGGRLEAAGREYAQYHLVDCDVCLAAFQDVRDFFDTRRESEGSLPVAGEAQWETVWAATEGTRAANEVSPMVVPGRWWYHPRIAVSLGAILLGALILTGVWAMKLRREKLQAAAELHEATTKLQAVQNTERDQIQKLEQENLSLREQARANEQNPRSQASPPRQDTKTAPPSSDQIALNTPIFDIYPETSIGRSSRESKSNRVKIPEDARSVTLILNGDGQATFPAYAIAITGPNNEAIWRGEGLKRGQYGNFVITVDRSHLSSGTYRLKVSGRSNANVQTVAQYVLRID